MNQNKAMALAGSLWCTIGVVLMLRGLSFIQAMMESSIRGPVYLFIEKFSLSQSLSTPVVLLLIGVFIGFVKGNTVLKKGAEKNIERLKLLKIVPIWKVFPVAGWVIMGVMSMIGMVVRYAGIPLDIRAVILVAVGSGLIQGGMTYFSGMIKQMLIKP